ncbi:hypothetical protein NKG05_04445 [Oerskovia sp. M15]
MAAWILFPVLGLVATLIVRPMLGEIARRKVAEEAAWTDHAAVFEEAVAARDDLRTSLGQSFAVRRLAERSAQVHRRFEAVLSVESRMLRRAGLVLASLLAGVAVAGPRSPPTASWASTGWSPCSWSRRCSWGRPTTWSITSRTSRKGSGHSHASVRCSRWPRARGWTRRTGRTGRHRAPRPALLLCRGHLRPGRREPARARGRDRGARGPHGLRQVDARLAAVPGGRATAGFGIPRRRGRA